MSKETNFNKIQASALIAKFLFNDNLSKLKACINMSRKKSPVPIFLTISRLTIQLSDTSCFPVLCISVSHVITSAVCRLYLSQTWLYLNRHEYTWVRHDFTWSDMTVPSQDYIWSKMTKPESDMTIPDQTWLYLRFRSDHVKKLCVM